MTRLPLVDSANISPIVVGVVTDVRTLREGWDEKIKAVKRGSSLPLFLARNYVLVTAMRMIGLASGAGMVA